MKSTLKGLIWYAPTSFRRGTPHSFDELVDMAQDSKSKAVATWCVGLESAESSGWPGTDWVEMFLLRDAGLDVYDQWVAGDLTWDSAPVRRAFESFGRIVAPDAVVGGTEGALNTNFADAGRPLFDDPPGCLLMMQGSFMPAGENPVEGVRRLAPHIYFAHFRNTVGRGTHFRESFHDNGEIDMVAVMRAYVEVGYKGAIRPDHAPSMAGESNEHPGYEMLGRLYAAGYMRGLIQSAAGYRQGAFRE